MNEAARVNSPELTVSELSAALKRTLEDAYSYVRVRGEVSGYRGPHSSGHVYFSLKDEGAKIEAVIWRTAFARLRFKPQEGLEVIATGRLTTFPGRSTYQIVVEALEPAGVGALMALLEERKKKFIAEGLFADARKQPLPFLPGVIGVVTSPTGAVIRDILHRLAERFPRRVLVWPVKVQGDGSAEQVAAAIQGFNALSPDGRIPRPDLLIVARGGGSIEDLWSFNEESVVRAAAASAIPLISAVGHETDVTLIDFASDKRAPTPTAAAELAVPVRAELIARVDSLGQRNFSCWLERQQRRRSELRGLSRALPTADRLLGERRQRLDLLAGRLPRSLRSNAQIHRTQLLRAGARLEAEAPRRHVRRLAEQVGKFGERMRLCAARLLDRPHERFAVMGARLAAALRANRAAHQARLMRDRAALASIHSRLLPAFDLFFDRRVAALERATGLLAAFSYHGVLARGFALVRDGDGRPLRTAAAVSPGLRLDIEFADGRIPAIAAGGKTPEAPRPLAVRPRRRRAPVEGQGSLFD